MTKTQAPQICALCGDAAASTSIVDHEFDYRHAGEIVTLTARVPVTQCSSCEEMYFGDGAEEIKHEAVCRLLGRLTPKEIVEIRKNLKMSQAQLAKHTRIGVASIKRWEAGLVIQGAALDRQLRNLEPVALHEGRSPWAGNFRTTITDSMRRRARDFSLRPRALQQVEVVACM